MKYLISMTLLELEIDKNLTNKVQKITGLF